MTKVVVDTCTYSNFARTGTLWILEKLHKERLKVTSLVLAEIEKGQKQFPDLGIISKSIEKGAVEAISDLSEEEFSLFGKLPRSLSESDKSCLVVAKVRKWILATDDEKVLKEAKKLKVDTKETVDILKEATEKELLKYEEAKQILKEMEEKARFQSPKRLTGE